MSLISRNVFRALVQGSQHVGKGVHTSSVNCEKNQPNATKEGRIKCTLIPGDGVGPELVYSVQEVFKAASIPVDFESFFFSEVNPTLSAPLEDVVNSIARNKICIKGILATPDFSHTGELQTLNMKLRNALDLYANVVHVKSLPNVKCRHHDVDCIIIREQTEGEYSALEHESMAKLYPRIQFEKMIVDNCTMQMVSNPNQFDVMVTPNLYGNIVDNLASGLVGGAGVVAGASYSAECAVFEQGARHIFSGAVGKNIANPTAMLLCSANLLAHVNLHSYSKMIKNAINKVLSDGRVRTKDLGGQSTTKDFTHAVISSLV
ncbi:hypothetical protein O3G_MSEX012402 [Manduca sexta]|uniref:Isopropylmalate dehydrogenase-like domain-containing protein n=1 Tax=Manduca sexta TaxID=7130 RepID=A0A922CWN1_MANSE|nr:hypothetical protein O3G_MSEX012402 [Manduca sexta]